MNQKIFGISCMIVLLSLTSCDWVNETFSNSTDTPAVSSSDTTHISYPDKALLLTNVDQLRMRTYPDIKSGIITTLDENSILLFEEEQTDYEETIGSYKSAWLRVTTADHQLTGWVFGHTHFVESFLSMEEIQRLGKQGKRVQLFEHYGKRDMASLTGANWSSTVPGTRYSGYYLVNQSGDPSIIDGVVHMRARVFDNEAKKVLFIPCTLELDEGMPVTDVICSTE